MKNRLGKTLMIGIVASLIYSGSDVQAAETLEIDQAVELRFKTRSGKKYTLQGSNDFNSWKTIGKAGYGNGGIQKRFVSVDDASENLKFFRLEVLEETNVGFAPVSIEGARYILNTGGFPQTIDFRANGEAERASANGTSLTKYHYSKTDDDRATLELFGGPVRELYLIEFTGAEAGAFRLEMYRSEQLDDVDVGTFTVQTAATVPPVPGAANVPPLPPADHAGVAKSQLSGLSFVFHDGGEPLWLQFEDGTTGRAVDDDDLVPFTYLMEIVNEAEQILRVDLGDDEQLEFHLAYSGECSGTYILRKIENGQLDDVDMGTFSVSSEPIPTQHSEHDGDDEGEHGDEDDDEGEHGDEDDDEGEHGDEDDDEGEHGDEDDDEGEHGDEDDDEGEHGDEDDDEGEHGDDDDDESGRSDDDDDESGRSDDDDDESGRSDDDDDESGRSDDDDDESGSSDDDDDESGSSDDDDDYEGEYGDDDDELPVNDENGGVFSIENEEKDVYPLVAVLSGTTQSEKLQGFESDDTVTGGGGSDLFPLTTGNDLITDFDPSEDMIDVGDFARDSDGFGVLTSLAAIAANSKEIVDELGGKALLIDVDGNLGDSTTTIVGIGIADLTEDNVFFGVGGASIPPLEFTHIAEFLVTYSNGDVVLFPGHDLSRHPIEGQLISRGVESD